MPTHPNAQYTSEILPSGIEVKITQDNWMYVDLEVNSTTKPGAIAEEVATNLIEKYPNTPRLYVTKRTEREATSGWGTKYPKKRETSTRYNFQPLFGKTYCYRDNGYNSLRDNERIFVGGGGTITFAELCALRKQANDEARAAREAAETEKQRRIEQVRRARETRVLTMGYAELLCALHSLASWWHPEEDNEVILRNGLVIDELLAELTGIRAEEV